MFIARASIATAILSILCCPFLAYATTCSTYPYTFTNGTTADANQVMSNFNYVSGCAAPLASPSFTGNVGIGTTSPTSTLTVNGQALISLTPSSSALVIGGGPDGSLSHFTHPGASYAGMSFNNTDTGSSAQASIYFNRNSTITGSIATTSSGTAYNTSSDQRIKTNIVPLSVTNTNGNIIDQLAPKSYNFIRAYDPNQSKGVGFVAQQLYQVIPLAVTPGDNIEKNYSSSNPNYKTWGVDLSKIVPHIVADLQWVHKMIAPLSTGVSCTTGSVNLSTLTVTNGLITHC